MRAALATAGLQPSDVDYVNLHGTATRANDAMEDAAVTAVFGPGMACSSAKGWSGHTLGACGILGALIAALAIERGFPARLPRPARGPTLAFAAACWPRTSARPCAVWR